MPIETDHDISPHSTGPVPKLFLVAVVVIVTVAGGVYFLSR